MSIEASNMISPPMAKGTPSAEPSSRGIAPGQPAGVVKSQADAADSAVIAEASAEKLQAAVDKLNELMQAGGQRSLNFSVDGSTDKLVVKVMDVETQEVIRQMPTEEALKFAEHIEGMIGLIFDQKA
ncbi:flagellar protein FlaG [Marinobacterium rhizophilum]|uniref:Flagellar protein FlaG n=1 Tax=Marinobacterium rhizophilum TaxID=420402 RepID=A0ABY5HCH1_9GAMM|nr:flagellar protein FlaG [Marinobacterium rhizophilum]UTW10048.1 flagellar protein FlaG [Marinobacterium rhizophilum]